MITLPTYMKLTDWADQIVQDLSPYGAFGQLKDETDWQNWAVQFLNNSTIGQNPPNPYDFTEWREWAERFCQVID